jgi:hypothetical protein
MYGKQLLEEIFRSLTDKFAVKLFKILFNPELRNPNERSADVL